MAANRSTSGSNRCSGERLLAVSYIADPELATALALMDMLGRPLLIEGEAGVGKTDTARALAGLNFGAVTPEEIALSIVAEIIEVRRRGQAAGSTSCARSRTAGRGCARCR